MVDVLCPQCKSFTLTPQSKLGNRERTNCVECGYYFHSCPQCRERTFQEWTPGIFQCISCRYQENRLIKNNLAQTRNLLQYLSIDELEELSVDVQIAIGYKDIPNIFSFPFAALEYPNTSDKARIAVTPTHLLIFVRSDSWSVIPMGAKELLKILRTKHTVNRFGSFEKVDRYYIDLNEKYRARGFGRIICNYDDLLTAARTASIPELAIKAA